MSADALPREAARFMIDLAARGGQFMDRGLYQTAAQVWTQALDLLPAPKGDWEAALWFDVSIGEAWWRAGKLGPAHDHLRDAMNEGGAFNAYALLRLGQVLADLGDKAGALAHLLRALALGGTALFEGEDPKYLALLREEGLL
jgi:tetratricopeptide (TPR) repeat protein